MKKPVIILSIPIILILLVLGVLRVRHGGGEHFEDRSGKPIFPASKLELVADLPLPPGNIAVSKTGRVFFTFHPEGKQDVNVAELVNGKAVPYPDAAHQSKRKDGPWFDTVLSVRIGPGNRLWTLDYASHGGGQPRLYAFDLKTNKLVHQYDFPSDVAGLGSMLNDFQIDAAGEKIYIADASIFAKTGAIVVYDIKKRESRRLLHEHASVQAKHYVPVVQGRKMLILGVFAIRPNVDSIALDKRGEWLYYSAVTDPQLHRIRVGDLNNEKLTAEQLAAKVEMFAEKTFSDGITMDLNDNIYISDPDHSAIHSLGANRGMTTLFKDKKLRWPDGFSFGPDGWLYVTCSSLQDVIFMGSGHVKARAPYQIFRFKPGVAGVPGQ